MSSVMSNVKIIEANFSARDAQLSARPTVFRLFRAVVQRGIRPTRFENYF
jgi:hypothetical protein